MNWWAALLYLALLPVTCSAAAQSLVIAIDLTTNEPVAGLSVADFDGAIRVDAPPPLTHVLLLLDGSAVGATLQRPAQSLIAALRGREQMAIAVYAGTTSVLQEFTGDGDSLRAAVGGVQPSGYPRMLDAMYAALEKGFPASASRKALIVLSGGVEGPGRAVESDVVAMARRQGVAIYPVYLQAAGRRMFDNLARSTGGVPFGIRDLGDRVAEVVFGAMRSGYIVTTNSPIVKAKGRDKVFVSALPLN